jgi:DNA-binding MarR family transcriptional regulator
MGALKTDTPKGLLAKTLWFKAAKISQQLDKTLGAMHGIGLTEYMALKCLVESETQAMRRIDLADALERTGSGVTRLLLPMEKIGLVSKESDARDARVSLVKVTPAGDELFRNASATVDRRADTLLRSINDNDATALLNLLADL